MMKIKTLKSAENLNILNMLLNITFTPESGYIEIFFLVVLHLKLEASHNVP